MRNHLIAGGIVAAVVVAVIAGVLLVGSGQNSLAEAAGRLDGQNVRMKMTVGYTMDGEDGSMTGEAISNADSSRMKMDVVLTDGSGEKVPMQMLLIRDDTWYTFDGLEELGAKWVHSVDRSTAPSTMSMAEFAEFLANADEVESKGETQLGGRTVEHFQGEVNAREVAEETGGETAKRFEKILGGRDFFMPMEAWIDEEGLPVRMAVNVEAGGESLSMTADILEYGVPVDVQPPPESDTMSEKEFDELTAG
jgi:hypothetical protein